MTETFLKVVSLSISASWLVLAVIGFRLLLKNAPKYMRVLLWGLVAFRLLCPVSLESELSLVPEIPEPAEQGVTILGQYHSTLADQMGEQIPVATGSAQQSSQEASQPREEPGEPAQVSVDATAVLSVVWLGGMGLLALYALGSYWALYRRMRTAVRLRDNVYQSEFTDSPFVLGFFRPRIYLPFAVEQRDLPYIMAHERAHIARRDHWWKPLGYALLTVHWFNPIMWAAYILLCRDIELACDEKVIGEMENYQRADYSQSLLACSIHRRMILACPVAFGEVGVKERVKNVLNYRKPGLWITLLTVLAMVISMVCFATEQPVRAEETPTEPPAVQMQETDNGEPHRGSSTTMTTSTGVTYTLSAAGVTPTGMRLLFDVDQSSVIRIHEYFWIEEQTEEGWTALERHMEDPALLGAYAGISGNSLWGPYDWRVDWSGIYGVLEPGTYRLWTTVFENEELCAVEFTIGDPGDSVKAQALERINDAVQAILSQDTYHLEDTYKDIPKGASVYSTIVRYVYMRAGDNYLKQDMFSLYGEAVDGVMIRDGVEYRAENEVHGNSTTPVIGWSRWPGMKIEVYTRWVANFTWNIDEVVSAEMTDSTVTLHLRESDYPDFNGRILSNTLTVYFDEDGKLERMEHVRELGPNSYREDTHITTSILQVMETTPEEIQAVIDAQNVDIYREFNWAEDLENTESVANREIVNTEASPVTTVAEVIDRAEAETDAAYRNILVYRDAAAGVWKVEFLVDNGKTSTEVVYLDDNGVTLMIVLLGPNNV